MNSAIVLDITLCRRVKVNRRFGGTYRINRQPYYLLPSGFLHGFHSDPEDGGCMFL
jgi:hypothetical protein